MASNFPNEVQENIFRHMDAENLMRAKKVCRRWNEIILNMEQRGSLWLEYCLGEIPSYTLTDITKLQELSVACRGNIYHHVLSKLGWIFWKEIFKEYIRTRRIKLDLYVITNVRYSPHCGQVTALAFNDLLLYSGFENGDVCLWKNIDASQISTKVTDSIHCPVQAIYCNSKGTTCSKLQGKHQKTESLMVVYKDKVKLYRTENKSAGFGLQWQWQKEVPRKSSEYPREFCSVPVGSDVWFEWYSGGYVYSVSDQTKKKRMEDNRSTQITAADSSNRKVVYGTRTGDVFSFSLTDTCEFEKYLSDLSYRGNVGSSVRQLISKGEYILCLTDDSDIFVSDGSSIFHKLDVHGVFGCHVECIAWYASILVIGTKYENDFDIRVHMGDVRQ
ncbi:uncharacterized protein LOC125681087 isoform X2 [Ostrea edulis]|uniref:uncharacterized protein LOC125681087 isoform X2 n=1 Tax=Ostrea edulis TaxID=37623 RepID=UPI0024AFB4A9|nr:uncharacterized protein LOC125681087 isoform X2 [Ostrea edulis]